METPIEGLGLLHTRGSGGEELIIFLRFILAFYFAGIFRPYIEFRETHKSSLSILDVHSGSLQGCCPRGEGVCIWRVQLKPNNMDSSKILKPEMFEIPKNMDNNFHRKMIQHKQFAV